MKSLIKERNVLRVAIALIVLFVLFPFSLVSYGGEFKKTYSGNFNNAWVRTASSGNASLRYGYNTTLINEDYAWAYHLTQVHYAALKNTGWHTGWSKAAGEVSKIEVTHNTTSTYTYQVNW